MRSTTAMRAALAALSLALLAPGAFAATVGVVTTGASSDTVLIHDEN
ncbi:MAG TPA: hypothetical protein VM163_03000 [bacterium]|nr:hypothetical protein [bacterium]